MSHVNDAIDEGIAPVRTGTPLRQLMEDAASALDYYKSPYIAAPQPLQIEFT